MQGIDYNLSAPNPTIYLIGLSVIILLALFAAFSPKYKNKY